MPGGEPRRLSGSASVDVRSGSLQSTDRNYLETASVFNTLIRLRDALTSADIPAIERAIASIDQDIDRVSFARAEVGARQQGIELAQNNLQDEDVLLRSDQPPLKMKQILLLNRNRSKPCGRDIHILTHIIRSAP